jgi:peptidoglycan hydrolase CwlO-like protein
LNAFITTILPVFVFGFITAFICIAFAAKKMFRKIKSLEGLLESEKLVKETLRKENALAFNLKESVESELGLKLKDAQSTIKSMDEDILLLQKSNEINEAEFKASQPEIYDLKMKLIEAQNTISRLKGQLQQQHSVAQ